MYRVVVRDVVMYIAIGLWFVAWVGFIRALVYVAVHFAAQVMVIR